MIPAAGQPAGFGGGEVAAGVQGAHPRGLEVVEQLLHGHGHHHRRAAAAGLRQVLGAHRLDQLGERDPVPHRGGQVRVDPARGVRRRTGSPVADRAGEEIARIIFDSICPCRDGDPEPAVGGALVVLPHRQRGPLQRPRFLGLQQLALEPLGQVGGDHLEQVPAQHPQRLRIMVRGLRHQVRLRGRTLLGGDRELTALRQPAQRRDDHPRLRDVHPPLRHRRRQAVVVLEPLGELQVRARVAAHLPGLGGQPVRRRRGTGRRRWPRTARPAASTRSFNAASCARPGRASPAPPASAPGVSDINGTSANESRSARQPLANSTTGCRWSTGWLLMSQSKQPTTDRKPPLTCGYAHIARTSMSSLLRLGRHATSFTVANGTNASQRAYRPDVH